MKGHDAVMTKGVPRFTDPDTARANLAEGSRVIVAPAGRNRTQLQNSYQWAVYRAYAAMLNKARPEGVETFNEDDVHAYWSNKLGPVVTLKSGEVIQRRARTSQFTTFETSQYIDRIRDDAATRDCYILSAEEWLEEQAEKQRVAPKVRKQGAEASA